MNDTGIIRLVRAYLNAGIMDGGVVIEQGEGTPHGSPFSPLLIKVFLDKVNRMLERRGHRFARYADDCALQGAPRTVVFGAFMLHEG